MAHTATIPLVLLLASSFCLLNPHFANAISDCNGPCNGDDDCSGQLICINGNCNDDPDVGTQTCSSPSPPSDDGGGGTCSSSGNLQCGSKSYPQYRCSPPITSSTEAILTYNDFSKGGDGGYPSQCDEQYHADTESVVALSTGWFDERSRCEKMIRITSTRTGKTTTAKVVDQCDSVNGCDEEHAGEPPCRNNIVDGSLEVWNALGLYNGVFDPHELDDENVTWSMA